MPMNPQMIQRAQAPQAPSMAGGGMPPGMGQQMPGGGGMPGGAPGGDPIQKLQQALQQALMAIMEMGPQRFIQEGSAVVKGFAGSVKQLFAGNGGQPAGPAGPQGMPPGGMPGPAPGGPPMR